jgi:hypothetical protein
MSAALSAPGRDTLRQPSPNPTESHLDRARARRAPSTRSDQSWEGGPMVFTARRLWDALWPRRKGLVYPGNCPQNRTRG